MTMIRGPELLGPEGFPLAARLNLGDLFFGLRAESRQLEIDAKKAGLRAGDIGGKAMSDRISAAVRRAIPAALGAAAGAAIGHTISSTIGLGDAMARLQARTGKTNQELEGYEERIKAIRQTTGAGFDEIADSMTLVESSLGLTGDAADRVVTKGLAIQKTFGRGLEEQMRGAQNLVRNFGLSGDEAIDLITTGFQRGGQNADDLLDTFNEYSSNFRDMGIEAEEFLDILLTGLENGARNTDQIADAIKEFDIRIRDGSTATREALTRLGIDFERFERDIGSGALSGAAALEMVDERLRGIGDSAVREQIGVALYGTKWEDVGEQAILAINQVDGRIDGLAGSGDRLAEAIESGPTSAFERWKRSILGTVSGITGQLFPVLKDMGPILAGFGPLLTPVIAGFGGFIGEGLRRAWGSSTIQAVAGPAVARAGALAGAAYAGAVGAGGLIGAVTAAVAAMAPLAIPVAAVVTAQQVFGGRNDPRDPLAYAAATGVFDEPVERTDYGFKLPWEPGGFLNPEPEIVAAGIDRSVRMAAQMAQDRAADTLSGVGEASGVAFAAGVTRTGAPIGEAIGRFTGRVRSAVTTSVDTAIEQMRRLADAIGVVAARGVGKLRQQERDADKAWKNIIGAGDRNKRRLRQVREDIDKWERRLARAIRNNDSEAAAFARAQLDRLNDERRSRALVVQETRRQNRALRNMPEETTTRVKVDFIKTGAVRIGTRVFGGIGGRADGGPVQPRTPYIVGERGPELFVPDRTGNVIDNKTVQGLSSGDRTEETHYHTEVHGLPQRASTPREVVQQIRRGSRFGIIGPRPATGFEPA